MSYSDVFRAYYDQAAEHMGNQAELCSFDEFCTNYYDSGLDLPHYTDSVVNGIHSADCEVEFHPMASKDADYICQQRIK